MAAIFAFFTPNLQAETDNTTSTQAANILENAKAINPAVAKEFGTLLVQDAQGRIKPLNTLSTEILDKVSGSDSFDGMSADEVMFGMLLEPKSWHIKRDLSKNGKKKRQEENLYQIHQSLENDYETSLSQVILFKRMVDKSVYH